MTVFKLNTPNGPVYSEHPLPEGTTHVHLMDGNEIWFYKLEEPLLFEYRVFNATGLLDGWFLCGNAVRDQLVEVNSYEVIRNG